MYIHGNNLKQKLNGANNKKYSDNEAKKYLQEITEQYNIWKKANECLKGPCIKSTDKDNEIIENRVALLNKYKNFVDQKHYAIKFDSRSNLHSTILEEFIYYLFFDLVSEFDQNALIGKSKTFKDIFFQAENYNDMVRNPCARIEIKDHDWVA